MWCSLYRETICLTTFYAFVSVLCGTAFGAQDTAPTKQASRDESCWMLGVRLSEASMLAAVREPLAVVRTKLDSATALAKSARIVLPSYPALKGDAWADSRSIMKYGLTEGRAAIAASLQPSARGRALALYDIALRSGLLLTVYGSAGQEGQGFVMFVENNAAIAGLPAELWNPFVSAARSLKSYEELRDQVVAFQGLGQIYLATGSLSSKTGSQPSTQESLWSLGGIWSAAAAKASEPGFARAWQTVETLAAGLGIVPLPPPAEPPKRWRYLVEERNRVEAQIIEQYGNSYAALFGLAISLPLAEFQYSPRGESSQALVRLIHETAPLANLPESLFTPFIRKLEAGAPAREIEEARMQVLTDVGEYLVRNRNRLTGGSLEAKKLSRPDSLAWQMGLNFGSACMPYFVGAEMEQRATLWKQARELGEQLALTLAPPPEWTGDRQRDTDNIGKYIQKEIPGIRDGLTRRFGKRVDALFQLSMSAVLLMYLYEPGAKVQMISLESLSLAVEAAELPTTLWQPVLDAANANAPKSEMMTVLSDMLRAVEKHLSEL